MAFIKIEKQFIIGFLNKIIYHPLFFHSFCMREKVGLIKKTDWGFDW